MRSLFRKLSRIAAGAALVLNLGCSGGSSPVAPTPPSPSVTSVTVSGTNSVSVGSTTVMTATAGRSDGSTEVVSSTATWRSSNPAVATVSPTGGVTAVSPGSSMISAAFGGQTGQLSVQIMTVDNVQLVTVALNRVVINGTCDTDSIFEDSADGEFSFRFEVERSGGGRTSLWATNGQAFKIGPHSLAGYALTFGRNVSQGDDFILWFTATESDGALGADPKLAGTSVGRPHSYQSGEWEGGGSSVTLGTSACGATIHWSVSSRPQ